MELYGILRFCMVNSLSPNIGFCYNFIITLDFLKLGLVKPHMEQDEYGILPLRLDSWLNGK